MQLPKTRSLTKKQIFDLFFFFRKLTALTEREDEHKVTMDNDTLLCSVGLLTAMQPLVQDINDLIDSYTLNEYRIYRRNRHQLIEDSAYKDDEGRFTDSEGDVLPPGHDVMITPEGVKALVSYDLAHEDLIKQQEEKEKDLLEKLKEKQEIPNIFITREQLNSIENYKITSKEMSLLVETNTVRL